MTIHRHSALDIPFLLLLTLGFALSVEAQIRDLSVPAQATLSGESPRTTVRAAAYEQAPQSATLKSSGHHTMPRNILWGVAQTEPSWSTRNAGSDTVALTPDIPSVSKAASASLWMQDVRKANRDRALAAKTTACGGASFADLYDRLATTSSAAHHRPTPGQLQPLHPTPVQPGTARGKFTGEARPNPPAALLFR